jgi:hypothetical protein
MSRRLARGIIEFLGSDLLEGRAPGTRGGDLAEAYVESLYKLWDMAPGAGEGYRQELPLKGFRTEELSMDAAGRTLWLGSDVMGNFVSPEESFDLAAEAVFVGFGISAEAFRWDDFKGADLKGKLLVARVNDPGLYDDKLFQGKEQTYFGRWAAHVEEARRRGAAGLLLIHTDDSAGYDWTVVKNSWGGETLFLRDEAESSLKFRGWVREASLREALAGRGIRLEDLYGASLSRDFKPVPLGFPIRIQGRQTVRELKADNLIARIPGRVKERIVLSAHIDHLGMKDTPEGKVIFNGAIDNATAVAAMLATAKALLDRKEKPHYTIDVLACQAEEAGLLGSRHFVRTADRKGIVANINFESTPVWERAASIMGVGAKYSTLGDMLRTVAKKMRLAVSEFSLSPLGFFFRADQFSFARYGIPSLWISAGEDDASGRRKYTRFWKKDYHTPDDRVRPEWPLEGLEQTVEAALRLVSEIEKSRPRWKGLLPFPTEGGSPAGQ